MTCSVTAGQPVTHITSNDNIQSFAIGQNQVPPYIFSRYTVHHKREEKTIATSVSSQL